MVQAPNSYEVLLQKLLDRFGYIAVWTPFDRKAGEVLNGLTSTTDRRDVGGETEHKVVVVGPSSYEEHVEQAAYLGLEQDDEEDGGNWYRVVAE